MNSPEKKIQVRVKNWSQQVEHMRYIIKNTYTLASLLVCPYSLNRLWNKTLNKCIHLLYTMTHYTNSPYLSRVHSILQILSSFDKLVFNSTNILN